MVAYTKPQHWKKSESKRLREERDQMWEQYSRVGRIWDLCIVSRCEDEKNPQVQARKPNYLENPIACKKPKV